MRLPLFTALSIVCAATRVQAQPVARCAPQVEATAAVAPSTVARLADALASGTFPGACPRVRLDVVNARLVMSVVLEDGRQVARVLATPHDALPTLVALTATPPMAAAPDVIETPEAPVVAAPAPVAAPAVQAPVVVTPLPPRAAPVASPRAWSLRLGASLGSEHRGAFAPAGVLDVDLVLRHWVFGVSASLARSLRRSELLSESAMASARWRWSAGRWQFEVGATAGWMQAFTTGRDVRYGARFGGVGAVGYRLNAALSLFARFEGGVERSTMLDAQTGEQRRATNGYYTSTAGVRWAFWR